MIPIKGFTDATLNYTIPIQYENAYESYQTICKILMNTDWCVQSSWCNSHKALYSLPLNQTPRKDASGKLIAWLIILLSTCQKIIGTSYIQKFQFLIIQINGKQILNGTLIQRHFANALLHPWSKTMLLQLMLDQPLNAHLKHKYLLHSDLKDCATTIVTSNPNLPKTDRNADDISTTRETSQETVQTSMTATTIANLRHEILTKLS